LLQLSVSPVVLISGVGLLLLSVTNRLGRSIDRSRALANELDHEEVKVARAGKEQLKILMQRAGYLRLSVSLIVASIFFSCLMILFLFVLIFFDLHWAYLVLVSFCLSLVSLLAAMTYLLADIYLSLKALKFEVARHLE
jgi:hypothetical protein